LSFHLRQLRHAGLVTEERSGRNRIYRANLSALQDLSRWTSTTTRNS